MQSMLLLFSLQIFGLELIEENVGRLPGVSLGQKDSRGSPESVCMMRNGINDFIDYLAIVWIIIIPNIIGIQTKSY